MYASSWSPRLRQGDIIRPTFLPTIGKNFQSLVPSGSLTGSTQEQPHKAILIEGSYHRLVVVSHCCEFNEGKRNKFLVARLQRLPGNISEQETKNLRLSNSPQARAEEDQAVAGVDSFVFDPVVGEFEEPQVGVFTSITAVPMSMCGELLAAKVAEFDHAHRLQFREKLAWFFGRHADDIPEEEKMPAPAPDEHGADGREEA